MNLLNSSSLFNNFFSLLKPGIYYLFHLHYYSYTGFGIALVLWTNIMLELKLGLLITVITQLQV